MTPKPIRRAELLEVHYDEKHWARLKRLRLEALRIIESLKRESIVSVTHGSIARGDVKESSDIDIFLPSPPSSFVIETALERQSIQANRRIIVQATPFYAVKGYLEIGENCAVSFPLVKLRSVERDFYGFGGEITYGALRTNRRVAGVDKRLMLIEPTVFGHVESSVVGREGEIAKLLQVSMNSVLDRVKALVKRDRTGRTGVFIEKELRDGETFEMSLKRLADTKPEVRHRIQLHG